MIELIFDFLFSVFFYWIGLILLRLISFGKFNPEKYKNAGSMIMISFFGAVFIIFIGFIIFRGLN